MERKKEPEIVFRDGFPLINIKPEWKYEIEEIEENVKSLKRLTKLNYISIGFIYGILFSFSIILLLFLVM
jgi:hypothetical protein